MKIRIQNYDNNIEKIDFGYVLVQPLLWKWILLIDVDECSSDSAQCTDEEYCSNTVGSFYCGSEYKYLYYLSTFFDAVL